MTKPSALHSATRPDAEERVRRVEILISNLLRAGVLFSLVLGFYRHNINLFPPPQPT